MNIEKSDIYMSHKINRPALNKKALAFDIHVYILV